MTDTKIKFPCDFPIKVMGPNTTDFEAKIITIIRKYAPNLGEGAVSTRTSKDGTYQSLTITVHATSKEQLDSIYQELTNDKEVLMAL